METKVKDFECENLKEFGDSMLYDSGISIACVTLEKDGYEGTFDLTTQGSVKVFVGDNCYKHASQMPEEVLQQFRDGTFYSNDDNYTDENNWWEVVYEIKEPNGITYSDGFVLECDPKDYDSKNDFLNDIIEYFEDHVNCKCS